MDALGKEFIKTRARFQRVGDAKFFAGWIQHARENRLVVRQTTRGPVLPGDWFVVHAFGSNRDAIFSARLMGVERSNLIMEITSQVQCHTPQEEVRYQANGMCGIMTCEGESFDVSVSDFSARGIGLFSEAAPRIGSRVQVTIQAPNGAVKFAGEVRYCRESESPAAKHRIGVLLDEMSRVDRLRWSMLLTTAAA